MASNKQETIGAVMDKVDKYDVWCCKSAAGPVRVGSPYCRGYGDVVKALSAAAVAFVRDNRISTPVKIRCLARDEQGEEHQMTVEVRGTGTVIDEVVVRRKEER